MTVHSQLLQNYYLSLYFVNDEVRAHYPIAPIPPGPTVKKFSTSRRLWSSYCVPSSSAVLRVRFILIDGSGSSDPFRGITETDPDPALDPP